MCFANTSVLKHRIGCDWPDPIAQLNHRIASHRLSNRIASHDRIRSHRRHTAPEFPFILFLPPRHLSTHTIMSSIPSADLSDNERSGLNSTSTPTSPRGLHESFQSLNSDNTNANTTDDASVKTVEMGNEITPILSMYQRKWRARAGLFCM